MVASFICYWQFHRVTVENAHQANVHDELRKAIVAFDDWIKKALKKYITGLSSDGISNWTQWTS
jgi:hypothetical protein